MSTQLIARNASLSDLAKILMDQQAEKHDVVVPASKLYAVDGKLEIVGDGSYAPMQIALEGIADKLAIPTAYIKRMHADRPDLFDANVNGWLHGHGEFVDGDYVKSAETDPRSFLLRTFRNGEPETLETGETKFNGIARAVLSQNFRVIDHLDTLTGALDGVRESGAKVEIVNCNLTERRMSVDLMCPEVAALAPILLDGYRNPFAGNGHGQAGLGRIGNGIDEIAARYGYEGNEPVVFAGFQISNSETGGGAFTITPRLIVKVCSNGMTITKDALRSIHLGSKMDDGVIKWSESTKTKNVELVTAQAKDAVSTFLDIEYVRGAIEAIEAKAGKPITDAQKAIEVVGKELRFSEGQIRNTLNAFILGGQMTSGGVLNAVTAVAQTVEDADEAYDVEASAMRVLELASAV